MFKEVKNIAKTAAAFLQNDVAPPNTPESHKKRLKAINHLTSKKFFLAFSGFIILTIFFVMNIAILYSMNKYPLLLPSYTLVFTKTIEVFATIMAVYIGGQAVVDLKYQSSSELTTAFITEQKSIYQQLEISEQANIEKDENYTLEIE